MKKTSALNGGLDDHFEALYSPEAFKNGPIGIQIVGRRYGEEELLAIAEVVEEALRPRRL